MTKQYENIYKETIKKLKLNIENEQGKVSEMEGEIEKIGKDIVELRSCVGV